MNIRSVLVLLVTALAITIAACSSSAPSASTQPAKRTITVAAVEPKGSATVDKEPFPSEALPAGDGYKLTKPDTTGTWVVETYRWDPGTIVVNQGDEVTLEIIGINGKEHPAALEGYNLTVNVKRGQVSRLTFKADKPGIFKLICSVHQPAMNADLVVLPRN